MGRSPAQTLLQEVRGMVTKGEDEEKHIEGVVGEHEHNPSD